VTDEYAAYKLCDAPGRECFGTFLKVNRPRKRNERRSPRQPAKVSGLADWQIPSEEFDGE